MKKTLISCLIMTLVASSTISLFNVSKAYAADTSTVKAETSNDGSTKISLNNIKDIITANNLDIKTLFNKMKISNETYHDALDEYRDYKDEFDDDDDAPDVPDEPDSSDTSKYPGGESDPDYISDWNDYKKAYDKLQEYNKYKSAKSAYESALDDYKDAKDAYESGIQDKLNSARTAYISYLSDVSARELEENTFKVNQRNLQTYKLQYESGFLSKIDYDKYVQQNTAENTNLDKLKNAEQLSKLNLCNTLGISDPETVDFTTTDLKVDLDTVSKINYDDDLSEMLSNNKDIKNANDDIDDLEDDEDTYEDNDQDDIYDYKMKNAKIALTQAMNTAKLNFQDQYNTLMVAYNDMKNQYDSLNLEQTNYAVNQVKYQYGFISKNDLEDSKIGTSGLDSVNSEYANKVNEFYKDYLRYLQMKEGY